MALEQEAKIRVMLDFTSAKAQADNISVTPFKQQAQEARYQLKPDVNTKEYQDEKESAKLDSKIKEQESKIEKLTALAKYGLGAVQNPSSIASDIKNAAVLPYVSVTEAARAVGAKRAPVPDWISAQDYENKLSTLIAASATATGIAGIKAGSITDTMIKLKSGLEAIEPTAQMLQTAIAGERMAGVKIDSDSTGQLAQAFYRANMKMAEKAQYRQLITTGAVTGAIAELSGNALSDIMHKVNIGSIWNH
jgi:hypothetical protein